MSKASNLSGFVPSIGPTNNLNVGVVTASSLVVNSATEGVQSKIDVARIVNSETNVTDIGNKLRVVGFSTLQVGGRWYTTFHGMDDGKMYFGDSYDLRIWHDGNAEDSYIWQYGTGVLNIDTNTQINFNHQDALNSGDNGPMAKFIRDGACELYHNSNIKFQTTGLGVSVPGTLIADETRVVTLSEKISRVDGNTVSLVYNSNSSNIGFCTNATGNITLNVTGIPTTSDFDNHIITFNVIVEQTGTARTCTAITLNGVSETIYWAGGSLASAIAGVTTTNGTDIFTFTGINTVGSANTAANYKVLGMVNGGFA